jgi:hypothetical protein
VGSYLFWRCRWYAARKASRLLYAERLAFCLLSKAANSQSPDDKKTLFQRALTEIRRAQSLGDQSNLLQSMLEQTAHWL